jgi:hypothetical protein
MVDISFGVSLFLATLSVNAEGTSQAEEYHRATKAVAEIYYHESGIDKQLKEYEKRYIPEEVRRLGGNVLVLTKMALEQKVVLKWEF